MAGAGYRLPSSSHRLAGTDLSELPRRSRLAGIACQDHRAGIACHSPFKLAIKCKSIHYQTDILSPVFFTGWRHSLR